MELMCGHWGALRWLRIVGDASFMACFPGWFLVAGSFAYMLPKHGERRGEYKLGRVKRRGAMGAPPKMIKGEEP